MYHLNPVIFCTISCYNFSLVYSFIFSVMYHLTKYVSYDIIVIFIALLFIFIDKNVYFIRKTRDHSDDNFRNKKKKNIYNG